MTGADDEQAVWATTEKWVRGALDDPKLKIERSHIRKLLSGYDWRGAALAQLLAEHGHQAERIAELVGQVEAQTGEIERLRARAWGIAVNPDYDLREEQEKLRAVAFAARRLLASWDLDIDDVGQCAEQMRRRLDQLAALGAADEPTTTCTPEEEAHDEMCRGCWTCLHPGVDEPTTGGGSDA